MSNSLVFAVRTASKADMPNVTRSALREAVALCRKIARSAPSGAHVASLYAEAVSVTACLNGVRPYAKTALERKAIDQAVATLRSAEIALLRVKQSTPTPPAVLPQEKAYALWLRSTLPRVAKAGR